MNDMEEYGYNRTEYLKDLAQEFGIEETIVFALAITMGPNEDFDGLISELEDYREFYIEGANVNEEI